MIRAATTPRTEIDTARAAKAGAAFKESLPMRFLAIWIALAALMLLGAAFLPRSVQFTSIQSILAFAAFLAIAAQGQALVIMARGIDLSVPAIVTLSSTVLLAVSGGTEGNSLLAIVLAIAAAMAVGAINVFFIAVLRMNALIVTLSVGAIVTGMTLGFRQSLPAEANVPQVLADFGGGRTLGVSNPFWIALFVTILATIVLRKSAIGRRFEAVGANPAAARASGIETMRYQGGAYICAALLYGIMAVLISGFIRNPTLEVGAPYLLAPIAAAVLGATSINGGIGSMIAVLGAALFLTQLGQQLRLIGLETSYQMIIQGVAIAIGMWLSGWWENRR